MAHPSALSRLYQAQERQAEAKREFAAAQTIINNLAVTIEDIALRDNFCQKAIRFR